MRAHERQLDEAEFPLLSRSASLVQDRRVLRLDGARLRLLHRRCAEAAGREGVYLVRHPSNRAPAPRASPLSPLRLARAAMVELNGQLDGRPYFMEVNAELLGRAP